MASTFVNDLRLNEMATGDQSGSWGTVTNTNLELIGEALGYGTEGITTNEVANGNGYTTGGEALGSKTVGENSTSGVFDAADPEWTSATFTARGALIYNKTLGDASSNARGAIAILDFGGDFTVSGGTFKIVFPANTKDNAIVRID